MVVEGAVTLNVDGAFYNPRMRLNRDVGVAMARALEVTDYLDALAASGARGLRVAKEAGVSSVALNDVSPRAVALIKENARLNGLEGCEILSSNANVLLHQRHFEAVDLDPFGSPAPFIGGGAIGWLTSSSPRRTLLPLREYISKAGFESTWPYLSKPSTTGRDGGEDPPRRRRGKPGSTEMRPLLTHASDHYVRTYLGAERGQGRQEPLRSYGVYRAVSQLRIVANGFGYGLPLVGRMLLCGGRAVMAIPSLARSIPGSRSNRKGPRGDGGVGGPVRHRGIKILQLCKDEIDLPMYYDQHRLCRKFKATPGLPKVSSRDSSPSGWVLPRTHFGGVGIKTDAPIEVLRVFSAPYEAPGAKVLVAPGRHPIPQWTPKVNMG